MKKTIAEIDREIAEQLERETLARNRERFAAERAARRLSKYPGNRHSTGRPRAGGRGDV